MSEQPTDPASPVPMAAPLTGEPSEPNQPDVSEVFPGANVAKDDDDVTDEDA